tara:strand:+ start:598 stop:744 length:147 start_codon:yes stop_codon:yes gene_type:complete
METLPGCIKNRIGGIKIPKLREIYRNAETSKFPFQLGSPLLKQVRQLS